MTDVWDPERYERFKAERTAPFHDLLALLRPCPGGAAVDLGCGTGELTSELHRHVRAETTTGIDRSANMLAKASAHAGEGLSFAQGDISTFGGPPRYDVVAANAALQWLPDHRAILRRWTAALNPGGQLAIQVPANWDHPSHLVSAEVAHEPPFLEAFGGEPPPDPVRGVLVPEAYAELLDELGYAEQHVRLQVYGHRLPSTAAVVDWVAGTSLTRFEARLSPDLYDRFLERYRQRLLDALGDRKPYFYAFKRVLFWGRLP